MLGGRYRLVAPVGVGSSSRVHLAIDTQLRRRVAVKLLHEALASDQAFLRRFRAEARAAGALSHPNIVAVYDWGEDRDDDGVVVPYLVTEYLAGGSLRGMLDAGNLLTPSQALVVGLDAARALEHAHRRGLVHRDVKPGNLLFDSEGRLRLADFGLARALAESSWTEPDGTTVGTARYASPEQALGRRLDARSDVYSLALVLVECVTGLVPLTGETTAATLAMRARSDVAPGTGLGALRGPLERAGRLDPDERPDAGGFAIALMAAAERMPRPEPLPLVRHPEVLTVTSELRLVDDVESGATSVGPSAQEVTAELTSELSVPPEGRATTGPGTGARSDAPFGRDPITVAEEHHLLTTSRPAFLGPVGGDAATAAPTRPAPPREPERAGGRRRGRKALVALAVLLVLGGAAGWWFLVRTPVHEVPAFVGGGVGRALEVARESGWEVDDSTQVRRDGTRAGEVVAQRPAPGTGLAEGGRLVLTVSLGPPLVDVPDVAGVPGPDAEAALVAAGLDVGRSSAAHDEEVPEGAVVSARPARGVEADDSGRVPKGTRMDLVVSRGPAPRAVPDGLVGVELAVARARLAEVQLGAAVSEAYDESIPAGVVLSAGTPTGAEVARGTEVALVVSAGPPPIPVPDVSGRSGTAAAAALEAAGFTVSGIEGPPSGTVLATDPPAGEAHRRGTPVRVFTRR